MAREGSRIYFFNLISTNLYNPILNNMKEVIIAKDAPAAIGPYSHGVKVGNLLFLSGQIPVNPATGEMPQGIKAQTEQSLANVKAILTSQGATLDNVVKTTVFLADMSLFGEMNEVWRLAM